MKSIIITALMLAVAPSIFLIKPAGKPPVVMYENGYFIKLYDMSGDSTADRADYYHPSGGVPGSLFKKDSIPTESQKKYFKEN